ncbi:LEA type 2 family protein [Thermococcus sp. GR6]|uniref:LEA type 2 family protein n=1 Tax=Thermococcus sp. GR6 TaxID=1638256 RepID=UPI00142FD37C|nr:LEA type 2 family protein [Thermococcus sp. GR6]NJE43103.1 hypothetical protein [Thermococcus sp. GR6]
MNWKIAVLAVLLAFILWGSYVGYAILTLQPSINAQWGYVDESTTEIWINAHLNKPLLVPASIENVSLEFADVPVARVERFDYGATKKDMTLAISIDNRNLVKAMINYLNNGQRGAFTIHLKGKLLGVVPVEGSISEEVNEDILSYLDVKAKSRDLGIAKTPALVETETEWAGVRGNKAVIINHLQLYNPNPFPLPITGVSYTLYVNGIKIGEGTIVESVVLPAKGYGTVDVETFIDTNALPEAWVRHIKNNETSYVKAEIYLDVTVLGKEFKMELATVDETVRTDIMGDLNRMLEGLVR